MEHLLHEDSILSLQRQIDWNGPYQTDRHRSFNQDGTQDPIYPKSSVAYSREPNSSIFFDSLHEEVILFRGKVPNEVFISDKYANAWIRFPLILQNPQQSVIQSASFSPHRNYLAIRLSSNEIQIYDTFNGILIESRACNDTTASIITVLWLNPNALTAISPQEPLHFTTHFNINNSNSALAYQSSLQGPMQQEAYLSTSLVRKISPEELVKQSYGSDNGLAAQHNIYSLLPNHTFQQHHANDCSTFDLSIERLLDHSISHDRGSLTSPTSTMSSSSHAHLVHHQDPNGLPTTESPSDSQKHLGPGSAQSDTRVPRSINHMRSQRPLGASATIIDDPNDPFFSPPSESDDDNGEDGEDDESDDQEPHGKQTPPLLGDLTQVSDITAIRRDRRADAPTTHPITCLQDRQDRVPQFLVLLTNIGFEIQCLFQDNLQRRATVPIMIADYWFDGRTNTLLLSSPNRLMYLYSLLYRQPQPAAPPQQPLQHQQQAGQSTLLKRPQPVGFPVIEARRIAKFEIDERYQGDDSEDNATTTSNTKASDQSAEDTRDARSKDDEKETDIPTLFGRKVSQQLRSYLATDTSNVQTLSPPLHRLAAHVQSTQRQHTQSTTKSRATGRTGEFSKQKLLQEHDKAAHQLQSLHIPTGRDGLLGFGTPISDSVFLEGPSNTLVHHSGTGDDSTSSSPQQLQQPPSQPSEAPGATTVSQPNPSPPPVTSGYRISLLTIYGRVYVALHDELSGSLLLFTHTTRGFLQTNTFLTECVGRCIVAVRDDLLCIVQANNDLIEVDAYLRNALCTAASPHSSLIGTTIDQRDARVAHQRDNGTPTPSHVYIASRCCVIDIRVSGAAALTNQWIILAHLDQAPNGDFGAIPQLPQQTVLESCQRHFNQTIPNYSSQTTLLLLPDSFTRGAQVVGTAANSTGQTLQFPNENTLFVFYPPNYLITTTKECTTGSLFTIAPRYQQIILRASHTQYPLLLGLFVHRRPVICKLLTLLLLRTMLLTEQAGQLSDILFEMYRELQEFSPSIDYSRQLAGLPLSLGSIEQLVAHALTPGPSTAPSHVKSLYTYNNIECLYCHHVRTTSLDGPNAQKPINSVSSSTSAQPDSVSRGQTGLSSFTWLLSRTFVSSIRHSFDSVHDIVYWGDNNYVPVTPPPFPSAAATTDARVRKDHSTSTTASRGTNHQAKTDSQPSLPTISYRLPLLNIMTKENYSLITQSDIINYVYIPIYYHTMTCPSLNICTTCGTHANKSTPPSPLLLNCPECRAKSKIRSLRLDVLTDTVIEHIRSLFRYQISVQPSLIALLTLILLKQRDFDQLSQVLFQDTVDDNLEMVRLLVWFTDAYEDYYNILQHQYYSPTSPSASHRALDPTIPMLNLMDDECIYAEINYILNPKQSNLTPLLFPFMEELDRYHLILKITTSRRNQVWKDYGTHHLPPQAYYDAMWHQSVLRSRWHQQRQKYCLAVFPKTIINNTSDGTLEELNTTTFSKPLHGGDEEAAGTTTGSPAPTTAAFSLSASPVLPFSKSIYDILFRTSSGIHILTLLIERLQATASLRLISNTSKLFVSESRQLVLKSAEFTGDDLALYSIHRFIESGNLRQKKHTTAATDSRKKRISFL